jgi:hypothetical protein
LFSDDPAATIWNGEFAVLTSTGSLLLLVVFVCASAAKTMVFPILGGLLHIHCPAAATILDHKLSSLGWLSVPVVFTLLHVVSGGNANTIQFPPRSLNGFGSLLPTVYGPKHIAIPRPSVRVGAT